MKVKKVSPSSGLQRNLLLAAVAWVAGRLGSDPGGAARKTAGKAKRRTATSGKAKRGNAAKAKNRPAGKPDTSGKPDASDKKRAAAEKAERKARAKIAAMPPKIVAKQSRKAAKLTKKSRAGK
jgi:hypothetical protein